MNPLFERVILIILDGVGAGEAPDTAQFNDTGANTLGNLSNKRPLHLPNLRRWGIGNVTPMKGTPPLTKNDHNNCAFGVMKEHSAGKDTTSGHWEMMGVPVLNAFPVFPNGFPKEIIDRWCKENDLPGVLGNEPASGTEIITRLGEEHIQTGKPIVYTSADSVWQVACHEEFFGLDRLIQICHSARKICDEMNISRVIARPFIGKNASEFKRTYNRKDLSLLPLHESYLDLLTQKKILTLGIGKITNIYADQGIQRNIHTEGNTDGISKLIEQIKKEEKGLLFCNLIDTDMLYGHRRDVEGFAQALEEFDQAVPEIQKLLTEKDLVLITADHGNDPTYPGTDHTRELVPLLAYSPRFNNLKSLGTRDGFADLGATIYEALTTETSSLSGTSFLSQLPI